MEKRLIPVEMRVNLKKFPHKPVYILVYHNSYMVTFACAVSPSLPTGPWFIGELIDGHSGACFAFGVFIDGHFLEGSLTYVVGVVQVRKFL